MPYKYIGRTTDFRGKTLWEIVGNLKNLGVGRVVTRSRFERYPEPTFMKILKVDALPNPKNPSLDDLRKVKVVVEKIFRGKKLPQPITLESTTYKTDYRLIPKDEEAEYCKLTAEIEKVKILPKFMQFPPLLKELIVQEMMENGEKVSEPKLEVVYRKDKMHKYKIGGENDIPDVEVVMGLGTPVSPSLYNNVQK